MGAKQWWWIFYSIYFSSTFIYFVCSNSSLPADHTYGHWAVLSSAKAKHWLPKTQLHFWHKLGHSRPHQSLAISIRLLSSLVLVLLPLVLLVQVCVSQTAPHAKHTNVFVFDGDMRNSICIDHMECFAKWLMLQNIIRRNLCHSISG